MIMEKIKKDYNVKIISLLIAVLFTFNSTVYGIDIPTKNHLRPPLFFTQKINQRRVVETSLHLIHNSDGATGRKLYFVSANEIKVPKVSLWRSLRYHTFLSGWEGDNVFQTPLTMSDHIVLSFLSYFPVITCIPVLLVPLSSWTATDLIRVAMSFIASIFLSLGHIIETFDGLTVYHNSTSYIRNDKNASFDKDLLKIVKKFEKETKWEVIWTDIPHLLAQPQLKDKRVILNIGWIMHSDNEKDKRRLAYLTHILRKISIAIKEAKSFHSDTDAVVEHPVELATSI